MTIEERIKARALACGFDAAHITTAAQPGHGEYARAWLAAGMHGEMAYLENRAALRAGPPSDPDLLEGARSVLVVALSYHFPALSPVPSPPREGGPATNSPLASREASSRFVVTGPPSLGGEGTGERGTPAGIIARYARGSDYHDLMWEKLAVLKTWVEADFPGARARGFADSGPLRERELAARAGMGWQGKHTNLISLDLGNWFLLGALLTTLELAPDPSADGHCGTCTRCLTACPTGALVAPHTLDARRCISYLTIEQKGTIPNALRPLMGNRIFGCDDCLAACPWNDRARAGSETRLAAKNAGHAYPDLIWLLDLLAEEKTFRAEFAGTPLLRPGRAGLRRNVCVALGNAGGAEAVGPLARVLTDDPAALVRGHAAWALGQILRQTGSRAARFALYGAAVRESEPDVAAEIEAAVEAAP